MAQKKSFLKLLSIFILLSACTPLKSEDSTAQQALQGVKTIAHRPLSQEESKELMGDVAGNWFYGQGLGSSALTLGTIVVFPPYAVLALGNVILNLSGYESIGVGTVLPEEQKESWDSFYDSVTSGPGRFTSAVAGKEFVTNDMAKQTIARYLEKTEVKASQDKRLDIPANQQWNVE